VYLWIFALFDVAALALFASESTAGSRPPGLRTPHLGTAPAIIALVATYALQLEVVGYAVHHQALPLGSTGVLPLPLLGRIASNPDLVSLAMLVCGGVQTYALWNLYRCAWLPRAVFTGAAVMAVVSLLSPAMLYADTYAYVGNALLGLRSYAPPAVSFTGEFAAISRWWGTPVPATPYGPLWIGVAWLVTTPFASLLGKIVALRLLGLLSLAGLLAVLRAAGLPRRVLLLLALNPALYFQFVVSAHNDVFGILLVIAGGLYVRAKPFVATALLTAGALVKLPFALFAAPLLVAQTSLPVRAGMLVAVVALATAGTLLAGGAGYLHAQSSHLTSYGFAAVTTAAVAIVALVLIGRAFLGKRRFLSAVWLIPLVPAYTLAWYVLWSLPYAIARRRIAAYLLICYPLASILFEVQFMRPWTLFVVLPTVVAVQALAWRRP